MTDQLLTDIDAPAAATGDEPQGQPGDDLQIPPFTPEQYATLQRLGQLTALLDVNAARIEQVTKWGYTDESDANEPIWWHAKKAVQRVGDAVDILRSTNPANPADRLTAARKKLVKGLALGLAAIDRIDAVTAKQKGSN